MLHLLSLHLPPPPIRVISEHKLTDARKGQILLTGYDDVVDVYVDAGTEELGRMSVREALRNPEVRDAVGKVFNKGDEVIALWVSQQKGSVGLLLIGVDGSKVLRIWPAGSEASNFSIRSSLIKRYAAK